MKKPPHPEEEYFAKLELEQLKALAEKTRGELANAELTRLQALHHNHCPACGLPLSPLAFKGFTIRRCFHCGGAFLEKGTMEALLGEESHIIERILEIFKF